MGLFPNKEQPATDDAPSEPTVELVVEDATPVEEAPLHPEGAPPGPRGPPGPKRDPWMTMVLTFVTLGFWQLHLAHKLHQDAQRHGGFPGSTNSLYSAGGAGFFAGWILTGASIAAMVLTANPIMLLLIQSLAAVGLLTFAVSTFVLVYRAAEKASYLQAWAHQKKLTPWVPVACQFIPIAGPYVAEYLLVSAYNTYWEAAPQIATQWHDQEEETTATFTPETETQPEGEQEKPVRRGTTVAPVGVGPGAKSDPRNPIFRKRLVCPTCKALNYVDPSPEEKTRVVCTHCGEKAELELKLQILERLA